MRLRAGCACAVVSISLLTSTYITAAEQKSFAVTLAYDYSQGDYGSSSDTRIHYLPLSISTGTFPWKFKATVPMIRISGPGVVIGGADGGIVTGDEKDTRTTEQGIGDIILSATYAMDNLWSTPPYFDVTAKIKLPTGDEDKFLGTGETDFSLQLDIANSFDKLTPFGTLGYKIVGDPESFDYHNSLFVSAGANYRLSAVQAAGVVFDYRQAVVDQVADPTEGIVYFNWKARPQLSVMVYAVAGFSSGSPDNGLGLQLKYTR